MSYQSDIKELIKSHSNFDTSNIEDVANYHGEDPEYVKRDLIDQLVFRLNRMSRCDSDWTPLIDRLYKLTGHRYG